MKDQPFLLILLVGTGLIIIGLALGMGLGQKKDRANQPLEIIHTKPIISEPKPVSPPSSQSDDQKHPDTANL